MISVHERLDVEMCMITSDLVDALCPHFPVSLPCDTRWTSL